MARRVTGLVSMLFFQANIDTIAIEQDHDWATGWASNLEPRPETVTVTLTQATEAGGHSGNHSQNHFSKAVCPQAYYFTYFVIAVGLVS